MNQQRKLVTFGKPANKKKYKLYIREKSKFHFNKNYNNFKENLITFKNHIKCDLYIFKSAAQKEIRKRTWFVLSFYVLHTHIHTTRLIYKCTKDFHELKMWWDHFVFEDKKKAKAVACDPPLHTCRVNKNISRVKKKNKAKPLKKRCANNEILFLKLAACIAFKRCAGSIRFYPVRLNLIASVFPYFI